MVAEEAKIEVKTLPKILVKGIEFAKYSQISLDELREESEYRWKYITCKVIS